MSFRLIALFVAPHTKGLGFTHYHSATLQKGTLQLQEPAGTYNDLPEALPLKALVDNAMRCEWARKVGDYAVQLDKAIKVAKDEQNEGNQASSRSLSELLVERGPWIAPSLDSKGAQHDFPKTVLGLLRNLKDDGQIILERKTIFLVPDFLPDLKQESKYLSAITRAIATELKSQLDELSATPAYGFLKLSPPKRPANHANKPGIMSEIIRHLLIATSALFLDRKKGLQHYDKEGPLLMDGPTGTGKSMSAELIALQQDKKITKVNIAATTETLLESRMRGHVKGAFTGANENKDGWFAEADGGILFLDEFQNATLSSQTQLLDLLDPVSNEVYISRIGEEGSPSRYNVKVILAVNKPVDELLSSGKLREDLFYRIRDVIKLHSLNDLFRASPDLETKKGAGLIRGLIYLYRWKAAPSLRLQDISSDISMLFASESECASLFPTIDDSAITELQIFNWTGNFRQFERIICDIHWQNDRERHAKIDESFVMRLLDEENRRLGKATTITRTDDPDSVIFERISVVENLLQLHNFNIQKTVDALKRHKFGLGSRQSLRIFLQNHHSHLKPEIQIDSKFIDFIDRNKPPKSVPTTTD